MLLRMPELPKRIDPTQRDFAYSEWRAALEAALYAPRKQVLNGEWVLKNFGLRGSDTFWTRMCQRACSVNDGQRFEWQEKSDDRVAASPWSLEVTMTRGRWATDIPLVYEIERHEHSLLALQEVVSSHRLDFLRVWIDPSPGPVRICRASAEVPTEPSLSFEMVLDDLL